MRGVRTNIRARVTMTHSTVALVLAVIMVSMIPDANCFLQAASRSMLQVTRRAAIARAPPLRTVMSSSSDALFSVRSQVESSLRGANIPADDMEEIAAILTTTTRSLERRLQREGKAPDQVAAQTLVEMVRQRCVEEEGLLDATTWQSVAQSVVIGGGGGGAFDAAAELKRIEDSTQQALQAAASLSPDVKEEAAAVVTMVCRSLGRRIGNGNVPAGSAGEVSAVVEAELKQRLVDEEALLSLSDLMALLSSAPPAPAAPAAAPQASAPGKLRPEVMMELRALFPSKSIAELEAAAMAGGDLEGAVFQVLSQDGPGVAEPPQPPAPAPAPPPAAPSQSAPAPAAAGGGLEEGVARPQAAGYSVEEARRAAAAAAQAPVAAAAAPVSGEVRGITTAPVTTGACSFGLCFDIEAKERPITVTGLKSASSPGLNWGKGGEIRIQVFSTEGSSRGRELAPELWTKVGQSEAIRLPLVSWVDAEPEYGALPVESPVTVPAGQRFGFLVHTSDLYGIVNSVGVGAGGEVDFMQDDEGPQPFKAGQAVSENEDLSVVCGNAMGAQLFQEFDGVAMPQPGGFVGIIEYTVG